MRLFLKAYPFFFFIFLLQNTCTVHAKQPKSLFFKIDLKKNIVHFGYFLTKDHHLKVVETNILTQYDENEVQRIIEQQIDATLTQHKALIFIHGMWGNKKRFLNDNIFDFEKDYGTANDVIVHIIWDAKSVNVATCRRHARKSTPFVTAILRGVLQMNDVSPTLMCHSMGNYLFFEMMDSLQQSPQPFEQILLVAADVSLPVFVIKNLC